MKKQTQCHYYGNVAPCISVGDTICWPQWVLLCESHTRVERNSNKDGSKHQNKTLL